MLNFVIACLALTLIVLGRIGGFALFGDYTIHTSGILALFAIVSESIFLAKNQEKKASNIIRAIVIIFISIIALIPLLLYLTV